ncbi:hypothetical protein E6H27_01335 [Candidatus Bathyarchaeota archaeon]|nr:MAG: hypothetical protein E6H27_01335 [Candidatus Bathyarchaeota archaeon]
MRVPPGTGLLFAGSGLYWVLSGPLIGWFSVLNPTEIHLSQMGLTLVLITGIACLVVGLWIIPTDFQELYNLFSRNDGWVFTIPIVLVVTDIYLTLIGLSVGNGELNPFVASAVQIGPWAILPFVVSYIALSEGLALGMLSVGKWLFGVVRPSRFMPFALICGAASFGPLSNAELLAFPGASSGASIVGVVVGVVTLTVGIYTHFRKVVLRDSLRL